MCSKYFCALLFVAISIGVYQLYEPLPAYLDDVPLDYRIRLHLRPLRRVVGDIAVHFGLVDKLAYRRSSAKLFWPREADTSSLKTVDTKFGDIPARVYLPKSRESNGPALLFLHGGGWVLGSIDEHDHIVRVLSEKLNLVAVSIGYRLAPEFAYPAALDDAETAFRDFVKEAAQYDVDSTRIAVVGDSAGGNLAAALVMRMRRMGTLPRGGFDLKEPQIKMQILIHPVLQALNLSTVSYLLNENDAMLSRAAMMEFVLQYALGADYSNETLRSISERYISGGCYRRSDEARTRIEAAFTANNARVDLRDRIQSKRDRLFIASLRKSAVTNAKLEPSCTLKNDELLIAYSRLEPLLDPEFSPLFTDNFDRVPPTYIVSCGSDVLRDDALLYVERLKDAQVLVEHKHYADKYHMFFFYEAPLLIEDLRLFMQRNALL